MTVSGMWDFVRSYGSTSEVRGGDEFLNFAEGKIVGIDIAQWCFRLETQYAAMMEKFIDTQRANLTQSDPTATLNVQEALENFPQQQFWILCHLMHRVSAYLVRGNVKTVVGVLDALRPPKLKQLIKDTCKIGLKWYLKFFGSNFHILDFKHPPKLRPPHLRRAPRRHSRFI